MTSVTEIGSTDYSLTLNPPVQLVFENKTGQDVFVTTNGNTTRIDAPCTGNYLENNTALIPGSDCVISEGDDLYVWTTHFSLFSTGKSKSDKLPGAKQITVIPGDKSATVRFDIDEEKGPISEVAIKKLNTTTKTFEDFSPTTII